MQSTDELKLISDNDFDISFEINPERTQFERRAWV